MTKKVEMNDKTREEILNSGLFPFTFDEDVRITPDIYLNYPKEFQPIFILKPFNQEMKVRYSRLRKAVIDSFRSAAGKLTQKEKDDMVSDIKKDKKESEQEYIDRKNDILSQRIAGTYGQTIPEDKIFEIVSDSIKGWENFLDHNGKEIPYSKENIVLIHRKVIDWLGGYLCDISGLNEIELMGL